MIIMLARACEMFLFILKYLAIADSNNEILATCLSAVRWPSI